jgi:hypothetical protein
MSFYTQTPDYCEKMRQLTPPPPFPSTAVICRSHYEAHASQGTNVSASQHRIFEQKVTLSPSRNGVCAGWQLEAEVDHEKLTHAERMHCSVSCSSSPLSSSCMTNACCFAKPNPKTHKRALVTQCHIYNLAPRARHSLQSAAASISHAHRGAGIWRPLGSTCSGRVAVRVGRD